MNGHMPGFETGGEAVNDRLKSAYQVPIVKDGVSIGSVWVGSTAGIYHEQEKSFLLRVNGWIWLAFIAVMIGVYGFSKRLSSQMSRPLLQIKDTANRMKEGDLKARVRVVGGQSEIHAVGDALNHLAESLIKQEKLRKTNMIQLQKEKVNLITVIHEAQRTVQESERIKRIHFTPTMQEEVVLMGDYRRLLQIFINLLSNAYKYTPENGSVQVKVTEEPQYGTIFIRDTGLGILPEELPYIFERFYRGEKSRSRKLGGAGIGLAVVKALVEAHGGSIAAESVVQEGTVITVRLPKL